MGSAIAIQESMVFLSTILKANCRLQATRKKPRAPEPER